MSDIHNENKIRPHRLHSRGRCLCYNSAGLEAKLRKRAYAVPLEIADHSRLDPQLETKQSIFVVKID